MTREELIAALEKATGPSRELDGLIHAYLQLPPQVEIRSGTVDGASTALVYGAPRKYTASIDAALTLVPAGCDWVVRSGMADHPTDTRPYAHVMFGNVNRDRSRSLGEAHAATPALALCIAALKAQGGGA